MNYFVYKNSFLSSANNEEHEPSLRHKYFKNPNMLSNSAGTQINSVLPKKCTHLAKSAVNKKTSAKSQGKIEELEQEESYIVPKNGRPSSSSSRQRGSSTSSQEYTTECEQNKTPRKNSRMQKKRLQVRIIYPSDLSTGKKIVVRKPPAKFRSESEKLRKGYLRDKPEAEPKSKTLSKMQDKILVKGPEIEEIPCGESGKWKYIRMYQERNRRREERLRRKKQKEKEEAQGSGRRRRSTKKRRKSKKRSKSRSGRKSRGRKSKNRSKSRRRSTSRGSSGSRSRGTSRPRNRGTSRTRSRRGSTKRKMRQG